MTVDVRCLRGCAGIFIYSIILSIPPSPAQALSTFAARIEAIQRPQCGRCIVPGPKSRVGKTREHEGS